MFSEGHKPEVSTVYVSVAFAMMELDVPMIVPAALAFVHWYESAEELVKTTESPWQSVVKPLAMIVGGGVSGMMDKAMDAVALSQLLASVYVAE
jgi:predicted Rossmann-fold nucleotide-binding protein